MIFIWEIGLYILFFSFLYLILPKIRKKMKMTNLLSSPLNSSTRNFYYHYWSNKQQKDFLTEKLLLFDVFDVSFVKITKNDGASKWHIFYWVWATNIKCWHNILSFLSNCFVCNFKNVSKIVFNRLAFFKTLTSVSKITFIESLSSYL